MPLVTIKLIEGRNIEQKRELCQGVTDAIVKSVGCPPTAVHIDLIEYTKENLAQAGTLMCDR